MVCHRTCSSSQQQLQHITGEVQCPMCTNIPHASPCNLCLATAPLRQISHIAHCSHAVSDLCASSDPSEPKGATAHCADHRETHNIPNQMQRSLAPRARVCIARSSRLHRFSAVGSSGTSQAVRQSGVAAESAVPHRTGQLLVVYCAANGACEARSLGAVAGGDRRAVPTATCRRITEREAEQRRPARAVHSAALLRSHWRSTFSPGGGSGWGAPPGADVAGEEPSPGADVAVRSSTVCTACTRRSLSTSRSW